ncbi:MAG: hypothetical protein KAT17_07060 [Candidatus Aminicenantes bacterium]|nr:hypothetical protein [Candidatus Aminicenantes bacterium]
MRVFRCLLIIISCCFLFSQAEEKKNDQRHIKPQKTILVTEDSDEPSKQILGLFFQISELIEKLNTAGKPPEEDSQIRKDISELLKKAVAFESDEKIKKYFSSLSQDILKNDFKSSYSDWSVLENRTGNLIIQYHEDQKKMDYFVIKKHDAWTRKVTKYLSLIEKMKSNSTMKFVRSVTPVTLVRPFVIADLLATSGINRFALLHPPESIGRETSPAKVIIFRNLARHFFNQILEPVAARAFGGRVLKFVRFESYLSNLIMHKIAHFLGPFLVGTKSEDVILVNTKLGDLFYCIDEIKADTVALCNTEVLIKEKLISQKHEKRVYATYVAQLLEKVRMEPESGSRQPYLIQIHFLLKNEGIIFNVDTNNLFIDFDKLKENLKKLMTMVLKIQQNGNYMGAQQLIKEFAEVPEALKRIIKKMENLPVGINAGSIFQVK